MLKGKKALITGGATGIGRAVALTLARNGADVAINYSRSEKEALEIVEEIKALGANGLLCPGDVADDGQVRSMVKKITEIFQGLDFLINSAGTTVFVDDTDLDGLLDEHWDRIMAVNVKGTFHCCRAASSQLKKSRGCIVNISSIAGLTGLGSSIAYAASKAAVISLTKSLGRSMAPHVRVNSVAPGIVRTRWVEGQDAHIKRLAAGTPMGRVATPEDVAEVVFSLIAHARFVTGQTIVVDGGVYC